jgi:hypothetical protein
MHTIYLTTFLLASGILFSCNKDKALPAPIHTYYIDSKINSKPYLYEDSVQGILNSAQRTTIDSGTFVLIKESSIFSGTMVNGVIVNTIISQYKKGSISDPTLTDSMFTIKSYDFTNRYRNEGIEVSWYDGAQMWSTSYAKGDQAGSTFEIVKHDKSGKPTFKYITSGNFSCKLYNADGQSKFMLGNFKSKTNRIN